MISSQPEKLLRYLLPSIGDGNNFIALQLGGLVFKLEWVKKTVGQLHYKLSIVTFDIPSVEKSQEYVVQQQDIVVSLTKEECPYKRVAEYVCKSVPQHVIVSKGMEAERSISQAHLYIVKTKEK